MNDAAATAAGDASARSGILLMVAAMGCLAAMDAASKVLIQDHSPWQLLFLRHLFLLVVCVAWLGPIAVHHALLGSQRPALQLARVVAVLLEMALFMLAVRHLPLADAHAILAAAPLIVTALAWPLLGERVGPRRWLAVLVGFVGILCIVRPGFGVFEPAALIPLAGAVLWALFQVLTRLTARTDTAATAFLYLVACGVVIPGLLMPWLWHPPASLEAWLLILFVCVAGAVGHGLLLCALRAAPASTLQPFGYTLLIWATIWGAMVFGHLPDAWTTAGAAIVVGSGLYTWYRERRSASVVPR